MIAHFLTHPPEPGRAFPRCRAARSRLRRPAAAVWALGALALLLGIASEALAHAVVYPAEAPAGAYQKYVLRVPNERGVPTHRVEITFPPGVRVISFDEVPGWTLTTTSPDDGATFSSAVWEGEVGVGRFVEFGFIGVNPSEPATLKWDVVQTYADGEAMPWTGPVDSSTPASLTNVVASVAAADPASAESAESVSTGGATDGRATLLATIALVLALVSLGLAIRPKAGD